MVNKLVEKKKGISVYLRVAEIPLCVCFKGKGEDTDACERVDFFLFGLAMFSTDRFLGTPSTCVAIQPCYTYARDKYAFISCINVSKLATSIACYSMSFNSPFIASTSFRTAHNITRMCADVPNSPIRRAVLAVLAGAMLPLPAHADDLMGIQELALSYTRAQRFEDAEVLWTRAIALDPNNAAAFSNRGNSRISQGRFEDAVSDFETAMKLAPEEPDPLIGLGIALEGLQRYEGAIEAYQHANALAISRGREDAVALNNLGNAWGGMGEWRRARDFYKRAADLDTRFAFAFANQGIASLQIGDDETGFRIVKTLLRKYPGFADMHAVNAMLLWERGEVAQAETEWYKAVEKDARYNDIQWVQEVRRWPPRLVDSLQRFRALEAK